MSADYDLDLVLGRVRKCGVRWHGVGTFWLSTDRADLIELPSPVARCDGSSKLDIVILARHTPSVEVAHVWVERRPPGQGGVRIDRAAMTCLRFTLRFSGDAPSDTRLRHDPDAESRVLGASASAPAATSGVGGRGPPAAHTFAPAAAVAVARASESDAVLREIANDARARMAAWGAIPGAGGALDEFEDEEAIARRVVQLEALADANATLRVQTARRQADTLRAAEAHAAGAHAAATLGARALGDDAPASHTESLMHALLVEARAPRSDSLVPALREATPRHPPQLERARASERRKRSGSQPQPAEPEKLAAAPRASRRRPKTDRTAAGRPPRPEKKASRAKAAAPVAPEAPLAPVAPIAAPSPAAEEAPPAAEEDPSAASAAEDGAMPAGPSDPGLSVDVTSVGYMPWETAVLHAKVSRARVESQAVARLIRA